MLDSRHPARRWCALTLTVVLFLGLIACGGGGSTPPDTAAPARTPAFQLNLGTDPTVAGRLTARLSVSDAAELYQLSCRVAYDPAVLRPVECRRAALVTTDATFFTTLTAGSYIPVAFTNHAGVPLPAAAGVLAELEFEIIDPLATPRLSLVTDSEYLIARDSTGADLGIGLGVSQ